MKTANTRTGVVAAFILAFAAMLAPVQAQEPAGPMTARGGFDVTVAGEETGGPGGADRYRLEKTFHGDLEATAEGVMLGSHDAASNSGAYVAIERVTGRLDGREGGFDLVHRGVMTRGAADLDIVIVPDSGTGDLTGIAGRLDIEITADGAHVYTLEYTLPDAP